MSNRRPKPSLRSHQRSHLGPIRLVLEPLEARRLLAGIQVSVYVDQNGSRSFDPSSDMAAPNRLVYVDLNENGVHDQGEPVSVSNADGSAFFADLEPGDYSLGLITNSQNQPQIEPIGLAAGQLLFTELASNFLASDNLDVVWALSSDGTARLVAGPTGLPDRVWLGPAAVVSQPRDDTSLAVVDGDSGYELAQMNLRDGSTVRQMLVGTPEDAQYRSLVRTNSLDIALLSSPQGDSLALVSQQADQSVITASTATTAYAIAASAQSDRLVAISSTASGNSLLTLLDPQDGFRQLAELTIDEAAVGVTLSRNGEMAFVSLAVGGMLAVRLAPQSLSLAAILREAAGPVAANSIDGRIVTGSVLGSNELIAWETENWLPVGRTLLSIGNTQTTPSKLVIDQFGDTVIALSGAQLHTVDMSVPIARQVSLKSGEQIQQVVLGVRTQGGNSAPTATSFTRLLAEDTEDRFDLSAANVSDVDGDRLWFELNVPAQHGRLQMDNTGEWTYRPAPNFNGEDSASLWVFDGRERSEFTIHLQVSPVNDPPASITIDHDVLQDDAEPATEVGRLTIADPDDSDVYAITTSDTRFQVLNGKLYFVGGELDAETEPEVALTITATDGTHEISQNVPIRIVDGHPHVASLALSPAKLSELTLGATVGTLGVVNPRDDAYQFIVSDARFEVVGSLLKLRDDQQVVAEENPGITLQITATGNAGDNAIGKFAIEVVARNSSYALPRNPADVNGDGTVTPVDVLIVINALNAHGTHPVPTGGTASGEGPEIRPDVNGDGVVSPLDALLIINQINSKANAAYGLQGEPNYEPPADPDYELPPDSDAQAEGEAPAILQHNFAPQLEIDAERRRRENSSIDAELEQLLDQLSREQRS